MKVIFIIGLLMPVVASAMEMERPPWGKQSVITKATGKKVGDQLSTSEKKVRFAPQNELSNVVAPEDWTDDFPGEEVIQNYSQELIDPIWVSDPRQIYFSVGNMQKKTLWELVCNAFFVSDDTKLGLEWCITQAIIGMCSSNEEVKIMGSFQDVASTFLNSISRGGFIYVPRLLEKKVDDIPKNIPGFLFGVTESSDFFRPTSLAQIFAKQAAAINKP